MGRFFLLTELSDQKWKMTGESKRLENTLVTKPLMKKKLKSLRLVLVIGNKILTIKKKK